MVDQESEFTISNGKKNQFSNNVEYRFDSEDIGIEEQL